MTFSIIDRALQCPCQQCAAKSRVPLDVSLIAGLNLIHAELVRDGLLDARADMRVSSGLRCAAHNTAVGGAPDSQHLHGRACDIPTPDSRYAWSVVQAAMMSGAITFIELCPNHVHVDTRPDGDGRLITGKDG